MPRTKVIGQKKIFRLNRSCYYDYQAKMNLSQILKKTKNNIIRAVTYQENIMKINSYAQNTVTPKLKKQVLPNIDRYYNNTR